MTYKPFIVVDDDNPEVLRNFRLKSVSSNVRVELFSTWDTAKEFIEKNIEVIDAIVLDAKGQLNADSSASEAHLFESHGWVDNLRIPYAIYTAYTKELPMLEAQLAKGRVFSKGPHKEEDVLEYLKKEITKTPKFRIINKYSEPFKCFGGNYLDRKYETFLLDIITAFESNILTNPENLLFNPCRILLERVFEKVTEVDEKVLPYALINFSNQQPGLTNCSKYLNGLNVNIKGTNYQGSNVLDNYISQQIQTIIGVCHPASHEIQKRYSQYTFKSVLWAIFDVLIWLKQFIDERK